MENNKEVITQSSEQTKKSGEKFAEDLLSSQGLALLASKGLALQKKAYIVCLYGELGSGKTTFVQGLAKGLGITKRILSPTFTLIREHSLNIKYQISNIKFPIRKRFYHIDLYRIQTVNDLKSLGLEEIINDSENIVVIEWAEKMGKLLPKERIDIHFRYLDESRRKIIISNKPINK